jgi:YVTN family beta-propeller protein
MSRCCSLAVGLVLLLCGSFASADQVIKTIPVGGAPDVAVSHPDGSRVYVGNPAGGQVIVIDTHTDAVIATISLQRAAGIIDAVHLAVAGDGSTLYAVDENAAANGTLNVISTATNTVTAAIGVGVQATDLVMRPDGSELYIPSRAGSSLSVVATATASVTTVPLPGLFPAHVAFSPDGGRAYVSHRGDDRSGLAVVNTGDRTIVALVDDAGGANGVFVEPDGSKLYITYVGSADSEGAVIRAIATDTVQDSYTVAHDVTGWSASSWLALPANGAKGYLLSSSASTVEVINTIDDAFSSVVALPFAAAYPALDRMTGRLFIPHYQANIVSVVDTASDAIVATYTTGQAPWSIAIAGNKQYVTNRADGTVSVIGAPIVQVPTSTSLTSSPNPSTYGQAVTLSATVTCVVGTPTGRVDFFDGNSQIGSSTLTNGTASLTTSSLNAGTHSLTATYAGQDIFAASTSPSRTQTVNKASATATLTLSPLTRQYSDRETYTAIVSTGSASSEAPATSVTFLMGSHALGTVPLTRDPQTGNWKGVLANEPITDLPGNRIVTTSFNGASNYTIPNPTKVLIVSKEDARSTYTGPTSVKTACRTCTSATVTLRARVRDISATTEAAGDGDPGDVRNANVTFVDRSTNAIIGTANVALTGSDQTVGEATFNWTASIGTSSSKSFTIGMIVGNAYNRNSTTEDAVVVVSKP